MTTTGRCADERGAASVELAILVPALMLLLTLAVAGGRIWFARATVAEAAATAARAASLARDPAAAGRDGRSAAHASLATAGLRCSDTMVAVTTGGFAVEVGTPAAVSATVSCRVSLGDLVLPGLPGSLTLHGEQSSALDTYRSRG